jgi:hypothetical protein
VFKHIALWLVLFMAVAQLTGQPPAQTQDSSSIVTRMMEFNKKKDGKLTREEVTDPRLLRLFDQADANKDGVVTREELQALAAKMQAEFGQGGDKGGPGGKGDKGFKGKGGKGKGPDGPGGFGGGQGQPGVILAPFVRDQLNLTEDQRKQITELQKNIDAKLGEILTDAQKAQLKDMADSGPSGFGPPPKGKGGPGGFGGGPPKGKGGF